MSCGFTRLTVVHHGPDSAEEFNQDLKSWVVWGSRLKPCPGPPFGEGRGRPPIKPYFDA
jgi:hypothetical protein